GSTGGSSSTASASVGKVQVLYAGSLLNLMTKDVQGDFDSATGGQFAGEGAGSTKLAGEIAGKVKKADVFVSASTKANSKLLGQKNGNWESWYATFANAPLVLGYNPKSKFVKDLKSKPWNKVVTEPGFRLGATDPKLDPKGKLAAQAMQQGGVPSSTAKVFPETQLIGRLQSGQLDAGFFYSSESADLKIPTVPLGSIKLKATYTISVLNKADNPGGGAAFVKYLLGPQGKQLLRKHGLKLVPYTVTGDKSAVPAPLKSLLGAG
ncbi:MAG: substrate-binding domain-containing protein, partial [Sciscionella sp.]